MSFIAVFMLGSSVIWQTVWAALHKLIGYQKRSHFFNQPAIGTRQHMQRSSAGAFVVQSGFGA